MALARSALSRIAACGLLLSGCASIFCSTKKTVVFTSDPPGAHVLVDGEDAGTTPLSRELDSSRSHSVQMRSPGYHDAWGGLSTEPRIGMIALDFIFTLGIGLYIDMLTGAAVTFDADSIHRVLAPVGMVTTPQGSPLYPAAQTYVEPPPVVILPPPPPAAYAPEQPGE